MEIINQHNCEAYFLDYYEKNLSIEQIAELMLFLENNAHLKKKFEDYQKITLKYTEKIIFKSKESLKKTPCIAVENISAENYEDYIIADIEKQISIKEKQNLINFLKTNPNTKKDYNLYSSTILNPNLSVIYPEKNLLKQQLPFAAKSKTKTIFYLLGIAASIILLLGLFFLSKNNNSYKINTIVQRNLSIEKINRDIFENTQSAKNFAKSNVNKQYKKNVRKILQKTSKETIKIEKIPINTDVKIASNLSPFELEINYNFDFYKSKEFIKMFQQKYNYENTDLAEEKNIVFGNLRDFVGEKLKKIFKSKMKNIENIENIESLTGWDIANIGLTNLSKISNKNFKFKKEEIQNGKIKEYTFSSKNFSFSYKKRRTSN